MTSLLSIVVVCYQMERELPRTLISLCPRYQRGITNEEYEVILVDNGSIRPPVTDDFAHLDLDFDLTILHTDDPSPSPVAAVNRGINLACGSHIGVFIDGARILSPGLLAGARDALRSHPRAVVGTRGRYLGYGYQRDAIQQGYDEAVEDRLLTSVEWPLDGYRLFKVSVLDESSGAHWFDRIVETNSLFMSRGMWAELNGFDEAFQAPGGGLVNLDTWVRACELPGAVPTVLLGEATFHQVHGGIATNGPMENVEGFFADYRQVRGRDFEFPTRRPRLFGNFVALPPAEELGVLVGPPPPPPATGRVHDRVVRLQRRLPPVARRRARKLGDLLQASLRVGPRTAWRARYVALEHERLVAESDLFDAEWYRVTYPEVDELGLEPHVHYLRTGAARGYQPGPRFDGLWYWRAYPDVALQGQNPLLHYLQYGRDEGRETRPSAFP